MTIFRNVIVSNLLLIVAYYISAHFTLSLSLPPNGVTPLWVPAGIAMGAILVWGYRLLPAVFIGDFVIGVELVGLQDTTSFFICILFGLQAAVHAGMGLWLLKKFSIWPDRLIRDTNIFKFFLLTAVIPIFIPTLVFILIELMIGIIPVEQFLSTLFMWWGGGVMGVVLFTPLVLIFFAEPKKHWRTRFLLVALPLSSLIIVLVFFLHHFKQNEHLNMTEQFEKQATLAHGFITSELLLHKSFSQSITAYFQNSNEVKQQEFDGLLDDLSIIHDDVLSVEWVEYLKHEDRTDFEQQSGYPVIEIDNNNKKIVTAKKRQDYYVIKYSRLLHDYPINMTPSLSFIGLDVCADESQAQKCDLMSLTRESVLMDPSFLHGEQLLIPEVSNFLVYVSPVFDSNNHLTGMIRQIVEYKDLINNLITSNEKKWIEVTIRNLSDDHELFSSFSSNNRYIVTKDIEALKYEHVIEFGGEQWKVEYVPSQLFIDTYSRWTLYWIMTFSLIVLSLISVFLLSMTGRVQQIKQEVEHKTHEIKANTLQLVESEKKYRRLVEGLQNEYFVYTYDIRNGYTYVSPSIESILGYTQEEFLEHHSAYIPDSHLNHLLSEYRQRMMEGEKISSYELEITHKNGSLHTLRITENALNDPFDNNVSIEGIAQDITEYKAERLQRDKLALVVTHSPSAVMITTHEGVIEYINPKFTSITGYEMTELVGKEANIVKSGLTIPSVYDELWNTLLSGHEWWGEIQNRKKNGDLYWAREHICPLFDQRGKLTHFVSTIDDVTETKRLNDETSYQASHDLLTGLINRREFEQRIVRVINSCKDDLSEHALCFMDLDQFKVVNDTCGHVAGDELLRQIGDLLRTNIRQRDTLARLGGDEFALLMEHCGVDQAYDLCQKLIEVLADFRFLWEEHIFTIGVSIGLAVIDQHIQDSNEILRHADDACYDAKDAGRNRIHLYTEDSERLQQRKGEVHWNNVINEALDHDSFLLYAQPIISLKDPHANVSYEILLRLKMSDDSVIPPGAFLPAAERYNSIVKIDRWVVTHTLKWISRHSGELNHVSTISINLSGQTLGDEAMLGFIIKEFQRGDVPAEKIKFEITETAAIANLRDATVFIGTLSELGCQFVLDDFGSGLSSFAYLKNLQVHALKIDGMFVRDMITDPIDYEMVKSINDIGHVMGLVTIAEFVENDQITDKLREIGVDYVQGFGIGIPEPIDKILLGQG